MSGAEEDRKRAARAEQVALFRYQLIREAADPALSTRQRGRLVRELAGKAHPGPFGDPVTVSRETIDRWIRTWRAGGFAALAPPALLMSWSPLGGIQLVAQRNFHIEQRARLLELLHEIRKRRPS